MISSIFAVVIAIIITAILMVSAEPKTYSKNYKPQIVYLPIKWIYMVRYWTWYSGDWYLHTDSTTWFIKPFDIWRWEQFRTKEQAELYIQKFLEQKQPIVVC